uniref:Zinc finger, CCHC-type n=1 Tax=Tanacetum cinerariifolium TaxID=118510 RepID=A0A6L2J5H5_TANCI|nr:zinc finger, CCHC-type [Tanacetum cinerariifolium]
MAGNTVKDMTTNFGKLDKFEGHDFRRWQKKMHFLLTTLKVVYHTDNELLKDATVEAIRIRLRSCGIHLNPSTWLKILQDFKHTLKHGKDDLSLVQLGSHLGIEKSLRAQDSDKDKALYTLQQNFVAERKNKALREMVNFMLSYSGHVHYKRMLEISKDELILAIDENSDKCTTWIVVVVKRTTQMPVVRENGLRTNPKTKIDAIAWWIDPGATTHACKDRCWFKTFEPVVVVRLPNRKKKTLGEKGIDCIFVGYAEHFKAYRPKDIILDSDESQRDDHSDDVPSEIYEPHKAKRKESIDDEIRSIMENNTWVLSDLPPGCKPLGFRQKKGIDYFDTYAPVSRITTIRLLLALAAIHNLVIHQMDVKTTFLNGDLDEEVYMNQPEGFVMPGNEHKVCKLVKSLYELKQAPKQWHQKFEEVVLSSGFHLNQSDKCVYSKFDDSGKGVIICLYVDDMIIFGTDQNQVDKTKKFLSSRFSMKDMEEADVILGIKIKRENKGIVITQSHYIEKILKKFNREDCSPVYQYPSVLEGYSDASWINHVEDSSSTSGWVFLLGGGAISWAFKKQTCITGSTMESEFVALVVAGARTKRTTYVNMKFCHFKKLGLGFLYVH